MVVELAIPDSFGLYPYTLISIQNFNGSAMIVPTEMWRAYTLRAPFSETTLTVHVPIACNYKGQEVSRALRKLGLWLIPESTAQEWLRKTRNHLSVFQIQEAGSIGISWRWYWAREVVSWIRKTFPACTKCGRPQRRWIWGDLLYSRKNWREMDRIQKELPGLCPSCFLVEVKSLSKEKRWLKEGRRRFREVKKWLRECQEA